MPQIYDQYVNSTVYEDVLLSEYRGQTWIPSVPYSVTSAEIRVMWNNASPPESALKMYITQISVQAAGSCFPVVQPPLLTAQALVFGSAATSALTTVPSWYGVSFNSPCPVVTANYYSLIWTCPASYAGASAMYFSGSNGADYPTAATDTVVHLFQTQSSISVNGWQTLNSLAGDFAFRIYGLQTTPLSASAGLPGDKTR